MTPIPQLTFCGVADSINEAMAIPQRGDRVIAGGPALFFLDPTEARHILGRLPLHLDDEHVARLIDAIADDHGLAVRYLGRLASGLLVFAVRIVSPVDRRLPRQLLLFDPPGIQ